MMHVLIIPVWLELIIVVMVAAGTSILSAAFGARRGARMAIEVCSRNWDCKMAKAGPQAMDTADLEAQLAELRARNPELAAIHKAMERADSTPVRTRAKEDEGMDGNK